MNEIELEVDGKIYRLTNINNLNKYDRAKKDAGPNATPIQIITHYDKLGASIQDKYGDEITGGLFWTDKESKKKQNQKTKNKFYNCEHDWTILSNDDKNSPGVSKCNKCGLWLYHSNRLQLEMNKHTTSFQKKTSVVTLVIAVVALIVAIFK